MRYNAVPQFREKETMTGAGQSKQQPNRAASAKWLRLLTELWIAGVIIAFFVIRILGSSTTQRFLHKMSH